ncbi:hypothetical protein [Kribbella endophytica]
MGAGVTVKSKALPVLVAVLLIGAIGWATWDRTHWDRVRDGQAFGEDASGTHLGMTAVRQGDEIWYLAPALTNVDGGRLTLESATPVDVSAGIEAIDAAVYRKDDYPQGPPLSWGADGASSPARRVSRPLHGYPLAEGQAMDDLIYLHVRVTTAQRPVQFTGVAVEYRQSGRRFRQVIPVKFSVENPGAY